MCGMVTLLLVAVTKRIYLPKCNRFLGRLRARFSPHEHKNVRNFLLMEMISRTIKVYTLLVVPTMLTYAYHIEYYSRPNASSQVSRKQGLPRSFSQELQFNIRLIARVG